MHFLVPLPRLLRQTISHSARPDMRHSRFVAVALHSGPGCTIVSLRARILPHLNIIAVGVGSRHKFIDALLMRNVVLLFAYKMRLSEEEILAEKTLAPVEKNTVKCRDRSSNSKITIWS